MLQFIQCIMFCCDKLRLCDKDLASDAEVRGTVRRLADIAERKPQELPLREQACGFNHMKYNMILDPELDRVLKPVAHKAHDWMHALMVSGAFNIMLFLILHCLSAVELHLVQSLTAYVRLWMFPKRIGQNAQRLSQLFSKSRWKANVKAKQFKCSASEGLTLYPIIWCYISAVF